jgi:hypothetical protein
MKTKIISFYRDTGGETYYTDHYNRLVKNLQIVNNTNYDIEHLCDIEGYRSLCLFKPKFILEKLQKYKAPILWLDIDSYIHKSLEFFDIFNDMDIDFVYACSTPLKAPGKASPLYFNYTPLVLEMLEDWANRCEEHKQNKSDEQKFDHDILLWETLPHFMRHPQFNWEPKKELKMMAFDSQLCGEPIFFEKNSRRFMFNDINNKNNSTIITMGISDVSSKKEAHAKKNDMHPVNFIGSHNIFEYILNHEITVNCYNYPDSKVALTIKVK